MRLIDWLRELRGLIQGRQCLHEFHFWLKKMNVVLELELRVFRVALASSSQVLTAKALFVSGEQKSEYVPENEQTNIESSW
jgi:hypothetical protein